MTIEELQQLIADHGGLVSHRRETFRYGEHSEARAGKDHGILYRTGDGAFTAPRSEVKRLVYAGLLADYPGPKS